MKISLNNVLAFISIISFFSSCNEKKIAEPIISEYKSQIDEYSGQQFFGTKSLYVKKLTSQEKNTYVYRYEYYTRIDSLDFLKDSVKLNNENLLLLNKKMFKINGKEIEIKKYQYTLDHPSNYFMNDSLGLIMEHGATHPSGTVVRQYNPKKWKNLCDKIITDSTFFSLQFDFDYMKKNVHKNSH